MENKTNTNLTEADVARFDALTVALEAAKNDKKEREIINQKLIEFFRAHNLKSFKTEKYVIRFADARETNQFDAELLQSKYPEIWKECHTIAKRKPHISVKPIAPTK